MCPIFSRLDIVRLCLIPANTLQRVKIASLLRLRSLNAATFSQRKMKLGSYDALA